MIQKNRNILEVINKIIEVAPELEKYFQSLKSSVLYTAPEVMPYRWAELSEIMNTYASNHPKLNELVEIVNNTKQILKD